MGPRAQKSRLSAEPVPSPPLLDPRSGSPAETVARLRLRDAGLHPVTQAVLHTPSGRTLRPDFLFPAQGLVVEVEGWAFHGSRKAHAADLRRFNSGG
ncbi:hypothetical protein EES40_03730 [Streptomyces sp. ADI93-02]|nr:hypothetical protein EES40_03730 [Streptomyces sp. ADI93-02]